MVTIQEDTTKNPIQLIGREAGVCWGADVADEEKNYKRGLDCIKSNHGRTLEFPQVYMVLTDISARVAREMYTHIGGLPTRLQESTRYVDCTNFEYITPPSIAKNQNTVDFYNKTMRTIADAVDALESNGVPREDAAMLLPLGMKTKVVVRTNARNLMDMSRQRMCNRAYWEYRILMNDIIDKLSEYSPEWKELIDITFHPKCVELGHCPEKKSCGRYQNA